MAQRRNDMRTHEGQERIVLQMIRGQGGFDHYWAFRHRARPRAIGHLLETGRIRCTGAVFPYVAYEIVGEPQRPQTRLVNIEKALRHRKDHA